MKKFYLQSSVKIYSSNVFISLSEFYYFTVFKNSLTGNLFKQYCLTIAKRKIFARNTCTNINITCPLILIALYTDAYWRHKHYIPST